MLDGNGWVNWRIGLCLAWLVTAGPAVQGAPRVWTFVLGGKLEAEAVECDTNLVTLMRTSDHSMFSLVITNLVPADRAYLAQIREKLPEMRLAQQTAQLQKKGVVELTPERVMANPGKMSGSQCYMDAEFVALDASGEGYTEKVWAFSVRDKRGALFRKCRVTKTSGAALDVLNLRRGDKARFIGTLALAPLPAENPLAPPVFDPNDSELFVEKVELLKLARQP
jgi:hypothetical protein